jgi:hypothetical protein
MLQIDGMNLLGFLRAPTLMAALYLARRVIDVARRIGVLGAGAKAAIGSLVQSAETQLQKKIYFPGCLAALALFTERALGVHR